VKLPPLIHWQEALARLRVVFPEGTPGRPYLVRDMAARTVFTALYVGAISGEERWIAPRHVIRMSDQQAATTGDDERLRYHSIMSASRSPSPAGRWYAENTREPLRDEVIRNGLVPVNALVERQGVPTTSPQGRYALRREFADLFDPALVGNAFENAAATWQKANLSAAALARAALVRAGASTSVANVTVQCPNGPSVILPPGPSPAITKSVVEEFAPTFLGDPRVVWISDSGSKRPFRDTSLETALGISLDTAVLLPDVILVDLDPPGRPGQILMVFVEVVASDGPVTETRRSAILDLLARGPRSYAADDTAFVTAYLDRSSDAARRTLHTLAWRSFAWFASEPNNLLQMHDSTTSGLRLAALLAAPGA
jgi:hypothetical protein